MAAERVGPPAAASSARTSTRRCQVPRHTWRCCWTSRRTSWTTGGRRGSGRPMERSSAACTSARCRWATSGRRSAHTGDGQSRSTARWSSTRPPREDRGGALRVPGARRRRNLGPDSGPTWRSGGDLKLSRSSVYQITTCRAYVGEVRSGDAMKASAHPAIVTEAEYQAAQRPAGEAPVRNGLVEEHGHAAWPRLLRGLRRAVLHRLRPGAALRLRLREQAGRPLFGPGVCAGGSPRLLRAARSPRPDRHDLGCRGPRAAGRSRRSRD